MRVVSRRVRVGTDRRADANGSEITVRARASERAGDEKPVGELERFPEVAARLYGT